MSHPSVRVAVVMERRVLANRWQSEQWRPIAVLPDEGGEARLIAQDGERAEWLHPGFDVTLYRDEAEGYYLNCTAPQPFYFVMWRMEDGRAMPQLVTVSYGEAARMMDSGEEVEGVPMPGDTIEWLNAFVAQHYKPEPKKRIRPPSFKGAQRG